MIYVFKTSVQTEQDIRKLQPHLNKLCTWSVDLDDCDKVLRVDSQAELIPAVVQLLQESGFLCEELP